MISYSWLNDDSAEPHDAEDHADEAHGEGDAHGHGETGHGEAGHGEAGHGEGHHGSALDPEHLMEHVSDAPYFEYSGWLTNRKGVQHLNIPQPLQTETAIVGSDAGVIKPLDFQLTKFMLIEVAVAIALVAVFVPIAQRIRKGGVPRGRIQNLIEVFLFYIRDEMARPLIGKHDGDKFVPYLWTIFFFVLFCNLFGLIPFLGSPTGAMATTAVLALSTFGVVIGTGVKKLGALGFIKAQCPHIEISPVIGVFVIPMIFVIEIIGLFVKHFVLSLRLFANMFAGHLVLAALLAFIAEAWGTGWIYLICPASVSAAVAVNMLEIFVAFLQAYIFTFLSALFIGAAAHPH